MRRLADELRAETGEERRISGDEDDPATGNPVEETAAEPGAGSQEEEEEEAEDEDEEEEDPGYGNSGDNDDDDDSPPASSHRPVTRLPLRNRFPVLNGRPSETNPGLGVAPGNGPGGDR